MTILLVALAARATIILAAAALLTLALRRASAATRHLVWAGAFAGVLLLPFLGAMLPAWRLLPAPAPAAAVVPHAWAILAPTDVAPAPAAPHVTLEAPDGASSIVLTSAPAVVIPQGEVQTPRTRATVGGTIAWPAVVAWVWVAGLALLLVRLVVGTVTLRRLVRRTQPIADERTVTLARSLAGALGIRRRVRLLADARATVPMTWGIATPVVVLPAEHGEWSDDRRRLVLAHELAHVARLDGATQLVAQLAAAVFWFHPLMWLALRELRRERERACDDLVLGTGARASDYARDLLDLATRLTPSPAAVAAFGMARRSELEGRVLAILDPRLPRGRTGWRTASLAVAGAAALTVGAATIGRRDAVAAALRPPARATRVARAIGEADAALSSSNAGSVVTSAVDSANMTHDFVTVASAPAAAATVGQIPTLLAPAPSVAARAAVDTVPSQAAPPADRATLLMVAEAAKRISSDAEKSTLLQAVYPRYRTDDGLRAAYLGVVATLSGDNARAEALVRVARADTLSPAVLAQAIAVAAATASDYERGRALQALAAQPALSDPAAHRAFFDATTRLSQSSTEAAVLGVVLRRADVTDADVLSILGAASLMSSSNEAANVLIAVARRHPLDSDALRNAFTAAARKLSSDSEYRRVMSAATISF